jgi:hypothetical protein
LPDKYYDPNYTSISIDRSPSQLAAAMPYQAYEVPSGMRVVQSGAPVVTKLDLSNFYAFADTVENIVINSTELVISDVESPDGFNAHSTLTYKVMTEDESAGKFRFANDRIESDSTELSIFSRVGKIFADMKHYLLANENPLEESNIALLRYDGDKKRYSAYMTLFSQTLFAAKKSGDPAPERIRYFGLYPIKPSVSTSVHRTIFNANNVKLKIYYTIPAEENL